MGFVASQDVSLGTTSGTSTAAPCPNPFINQARRAWIRWLEKDTHTVLGRLMVLWGKADQRISLPLGWPPATSAGTALADLLAGGRMPYWIRRAALGSKPLRGGISLHWPVRSGRSRCDRLPLGVIPSPLRLSLLLLSFRSLCVPGACSGGGTRSCQKVLA